jgi:hypothetical protein
MEEKTSEFGWSFLCGKGDIIYGLNVLGEAAAPKRFCFCGVQGQLRSERILTISKTADKIK